MTAVADPSYVTVDIVFGLGMLMFGKEPSSGEMWRWLREGWDAKEKAT